MSITDISAGQDIVLATAHGNLPAGITGTAWGDPTMPAFWTEPGVWVIWDDSSRYARWIPARKLAQAS